MSFVDAFMSKFKKVDESERNRLRTARTNIPDKVESSSDNSILSTNRARSKPTSSITQLRAFVKKKSPEELKAEDAARSLSNEQFGEQGMQDMNRNDY
jgi:hypothetical protein